MKCLVLVSLVAAGIAWQGRPSAPLLVEPPRVEQGQGTQKHTFEPGRLERVVLIGASLSSGFNTAHTFGDALEASLKIPHKPVRNFADVLFFTSPRAMGAKQVEAALDADATLIVALDFLFWFGYGSLDASGGTIEREAQRLELLDKGLALLEEIECPLVVGDFPDMSAAVGKMIGPEQMPQLSTLPLLSKRVREWAAKRGHTLVLPLSELVPRLGSKGDFSIGRHAYQAGAKLLQEDQLHPTLDGLGAVAQLVCDELVKHDLARETDFDWELPGVLARLRRAPTSTVPTGQ